MKIELDVRNEELANEAGVTIFTASRLMSRWALEGIIAKARGKVVCSVALRALFLGGHPIGVVRVADIQVVHGVPPCCRLSSTPSARTRATCGACLRTSRRASCPPIDTLRLCQAPRVAVAFPPSATAYLRWHGIVSEREKAEQKARERADTVPALDCRHVARSHLKRFRYYADQIVCDACDERNPQSHRRLVPRALLQPRSICVNFVDCRRLAGTSHGPRPTVSSGRLTRASATYLNRCVRSVPRRE